MYVFEYFRNKRGSWEWRLKNKDGIKIAVSASEYDTIKSVKRAIALFRISGVFAIKKRVNVE